MPKKYRDTGKRTFVHVIINIFWGFQKIDESSLPDDIEDPNAYSIEEAKQKAEYDKMMKDAEEKKREVRRHITKMRRMFKQLLEQNDALPVHLRLHKDVSTVLVVKFNT